MSHSAARGTRAVEFSDKLQVKPPTVKGMIEKLAKEGRVEHHTKAEHWDVLRPAIVANTVSIFLSSVHYSNTPSTFLQEELEAVALRRVASRAGLPASS